MSQRIVPNKCITVTKEGECHIIISLDLNININTNGQMSVQKDESVSQQAEKTDWVVPDFGTFNAQVVNFGKDV